MKTNRNHKLTAEVWNFGSYLSTRTEEDTIVNTYFYNDLFFDLIFDVSENKIVEVRIDELFKLNTDWWADLKEFKLNLN